MNDDPFTTALRAELDAVVARYEALVRAHQRVMSASSARDSQAWQTKLQIAEAERDRLAARTKELEGEVAALRDKVDNERKKAAEAASRAAGSLAEARLQLGEMSAKLDAVADESRVFDEAFAGEIAFVNACEPIEHAELFAAIERVTELHLEAAPAIYGALKNLRLDVVLTRTLKERGRDVLELPLTALERLALEQLAQAAACELIVPELGTRFSSLEMEQADTRPDPAEEGNVLECLIPGLRFAGSDGALVFPKVRVAVG